jgi:hypothetical protein
MESQPLKRVYFDTNALYRWPNSANNLMLPFGVANWLKTELYFPKAVDSVPTVCRIHPAIRVTAQNHWLTVGQPNRMPFSSFNFPLCVRGVLKPRAGRSLTCISAFLYRCASQDGVLEREGNGWSPPNINHQCGSETRRAGATLVPNARIDNTGRTLS